MLPHFLHDFRGFRPHFLHDFWEIESLFYACARAKLNFVLLTSYFVIRNSYLPLCVGYLLCEQRELPLRGENFRWSGENFAGRCTRDELLRNL